ncbi:carbohydrate kinase family protein [Psychromonas sp. MME2]|uniref:carbohydrate kinase family protein n=1 Tax=unclassified Psychromonas TaxID=2614957 RepID=UPI00339BB9CA
MSYDVLVSGLNVIDILVTLPAQYEAGKKQQVDKIVIQGGAPAGNGACGMAALGLKTGFLGFLGDNAQSDIAKSEFKRCNVDTSLMLHDSRAVPATALVEVDKQGERTVFYSTTGYRALSEQDIDPTWLAQSKLLFVDGYDIEGNIALLKQAKAQNIPSVVDMEAGDIEQLNIMLKLGSHVILPLECAQFMSAKTDIQDCINTLRATTDAQLVITDGANGSWATEGDSVISQSAFKVEVVDTTGCGDAYHAAYAYALMKDYELSARMQFASAFAAIVATHFGGRTAFPSEQDVHNFIQQAQ